MMDRKRIAKQAAAVIGIPIIAFGTMGFWGSSDKKGLDPKDVADMLHTVMSSDRTGYTKQVVNRLMVQDKVMRASEHFQDEKVLPRPAQMFRFGAELASEKSDKFSYSLQSLWPINKQNAPYAEIEKTGLAYVAEHKGENYYGKEELGSKKYFTAIYAETAVAEACVSCHNTHKGSPKNGFKLGDLIGAVVIRIPVTE